MLFKEKYVYLWKIVLIKKTVLIKKITINSIADIKDLRGKLPQHMTKKYVKRDMEKVNKLAIHHSLTEEGSADAFARYHVRHNKWPSIGYHYVIEKDGDIVWCLDLILKSYHVGNSNRKSIGVCLIGDFRREMPTQGQISSLYKLINAIIEDNNNNINSEDDVLGHSEFPGYSWKKCPVISMNIIRDNFKYFKRGVFSMYNKVT